MLEVINACHEVDTTPQFLVYSSNGFCTHLCDRVRKFLHVCQLIQSDQIVISLRM